jgi:hypothetical protein
MVVVLIRQVAQAVACNCPGAQHDVAKEYEGMEADFASMGRISSFQAVHS